MQPAIILLLILFVPTFVLSIAAAGTGVLSGDVSMTLFIQAHAPQVSWLYDAVNWIGTTLGAAIISMVIGLVLLAFRQPVAAAMILLTFLLRVTNAALKALLESPRPNGVFVSVTEFPGGYGFPSGHVMGAMLLYGTLFLLAPRLTANRPIRLVIQTGAVVMLILAGISRIYVGAHWPSDVIGGYLWGSIFLLSGVLTIRAGLMLSNAYSRGQKEYRP